MKYWVSFNMDGELIYCDPFSVLHPLYVGMTAIVVEAENEEKAIEKAKQIYKERGGRMNNKEYLKELEKQRNQLDKEIKEVKEKIEYDSLHSLGEPISRYDLLEKIDEFDNPCDIHRFVILQTVREIIKTMPCIGEGVKE